MKLVLSALIIAACGSAQADLVFGKSTLVFPAGPGIQKAGYSYSPDISADGRYISFITDRMDVSSSGEVDHYEVIRADAESGAFKTVNRAANGDYIRPLREQKAFISDRGRFIAYTSNRESFPASARFAVRSNLELGTSEVFLNRSATGLASDGQSLMYDAYEGQTFNPTNLFNFNAGHQGQIRDYVYSKDGTVLLASKLIRGKETGIQAITRGGRYWLFTMAGEYEYLKPVWVSNEPSPSEPLLAYFITNKQIDPFDYDIWPDLYLVNTSTGERRFVPLQAANVRNVASSRNGRYVVVQYDDGMADVLDIPTWPWAPITTRPVSLSYLEKVSPHVSDDGRFVAGTTAAGRVRRHNLVTNGSQEVAIGTYPAPPREPVVNPVSSSSGSAIVFQAGKKFLLGETAGTFIKTIGNGAVRKVSTTQLPVAVSNSGRAYILRTNDTAWYYNEDLKLSTNLPNSLSHQISDDGNIVTYRPRSNGVYQIYAYNAVTGQTRLVTRSTSGGPTTGHVETYQLSGNGRIIVFFAYASDLGFAPWSYRMYIYDVLTDKLTSPELPVGSVSSQALIGVSTDGTRIVYRNYGQAFWRYSVPSKSFREYRQSVASQEAAKLSPSGNLIIGSSYITRLSDGRTESFRGFSPGPVLPGDDRVRILTSGILRDVNFAFPATP